MIALPLILLSFLGIQTYVALQILRNKRNEPFIFNKTNKFYIHQRMLKHFGWIHTRTD